MSLGKKIKIEREIEWLAETTNSLQQNNMCLFTVDNMSQLFVANTILLQYYWDTWEAEHLCGTWSKELANKSE